MPTALEEFTAVVGRHVFLREFSFHSNTFRAACGSEFELADHVIDLPQAMFVFQIKERSSGAASDTKSILTWFKQKVIKDGCGQLRDSETYLREQPQLLVVNQRGHKFDLAHRKGRIIKIILHSASGAGLPDFVKSCRHKVSRRAGFVHVLNIRDYFHLCQCLAAPRELSQYFAFRQKLVESSSSPLPAEAMITAMFIADTDSPPDPTEAKRILEAALSDVPSFDLGSILRELGDTILQSGSGQEPLEYYKILTEFSQLHRADLRELRKLMIWALEHAGGTDLKRPCRMHASSKVGFVVFPVPDDAFEKRLNVLRNFTTLLKYDWKLECAVGISFARDHGTVEIDWCLQQGVWEFDPVLEQALKESSPFRKTPTPRKVFSYPS